MLLSPSLVAWAFAYPDNPVAKQVIACLPSDQVPKLKEFFEKERREHAAAASELVALLEAGGVKLEK
jgi:hypothetical protein